jgi:hypothetical protein
MARKNKANPYSPQPRKPIHRCERDTNDVNQSRTSWNHQNLKCVSEHEATLVKLSDCSNVANDDNEHIQQFEIKDVSNSNTNPLTYDGRQKLSQFIPECTQSCSNPAVRKKEQQKVGTDHKFKNTIIILAVTTVILVFCMYILHGYAEKVLSPLSVTVTESEREKYLRMNIQHIRDEFPSQLNTMWQAFSAGIKDVQETPTKASVFLLLHETEDGTPACLAWKIGNIAAHFLSATNPNPIVLDGANIENNQTLAEDYGILLEEYGPMVKERRTMIVKDLHKISGNLAQSFHWLCDTVTPHIDKAIYLFTMKTSGVSHANDNLSEVAEKELQKLWSAQLDEDKLMPLIVRITDSVMIIMPEKNIPCPDQAIVPEIVHL